MKKILVGLDASPRSQDVLDTAANLAKKTGGKLVLFRAVGIPLGLPPEAYAMSPDSLENLLEREAKEYLDKMAAGAPEGIIESVLVHAGTPWRSICAAGRELGVDLIVIGSHGYQGLDRLIGTTASKVVNHAECSVLVVRSHALAE
ncbi:MAG: universal stress protein [Polyangiaceae bacterium]|nr:universal stress protein [Polyangiaceae bacterium]